VLQVRKQHRGLNVFGRLIVATARCEGVGVYELPDALLEHGTVETPQLERLHGKLVFAGQLWWHLKENKVATTRVPENKRGWITRVHTVTMTTVRCVRGA